MKFSAFNPSNSQEIIGLFTNTFSDSEGEAEGKLIGDLVANMIASTKPEDLIGFTASTDEKIAGCIFFSRFIVPNNQTAFILSPVAIATNVQGQGVGQKLINFGLDYLRGKGVELVFTYGDPNYYSQVGFQQISEDIVKAPLILSQPEGWLAQSLDDKAIEAMQGAVSCIDALNDQRYW